MPFGHPFLAIYPFIWRSDNQGSIGQLIVLWIDNEFVVGDTSQDDSATHEVLYFPHLGGLVLPLTGYYLIAVGRLVVLHRQHVGGAFGVLDDIDTIGDNLSHSGQYEEDKCDYCRDSFFHSRKSSKGLINEVMERMTRFLVQI